MNRSLLCIIIIFLALISPVPALADIPLPGKQAPLFSLPDPEGNRHALADHRGSVVLLVFWATWCTSCVAEMPALDSLHGALKTKGFTVLAVSLDGRADPVRAFLRDKKLSFPVLMDSEKEASFDLYAVTALPVAFLIDRTGVIAEKFIGEKDWNDAALRRRIAELIDRKEPGP